MEENATYLILTEEGKYRKTDNLSEADYVRVSAEQYVSQRSWNNLVDKYKELLIEHKKVCKGKHHERDAVLIKKEEYNGFKNMLRIIRDRSMQQVEKAKADSHGYTFKYADLQVYDRNKPEQTAYHITKVSPISLNIDLETAYYMIINDLKEYYSFIIPPYVTTTDSVPVKIKMSDLLAALSQRDNPDYKNRNFYVTNLEYGQMLKVFVNDCPPVISFGPVKLLSNIGQGVYEISYWASAPI